MKYGVIAASIALVVATIALYWIRSMPTTKSKRAMVALQGLVIVSAILYILGYFEILGEATTSLITIVHILQIWTAAVTFGLVTICSKHEAFFSRTDIMLFIYSPAAVLTVMALTVLAVAPSSITVVWVEGALMFNPGPLNSIILTLGASYGLALPVFIIYLLKREETHLQTELSILLLVVCFGMLTIPLAFIDIPGLSTSEISLLIVALLAGSIAYTVIKKTMFIAPAREDPGIRKTADEKDHGATGPSGRSDGKTISALDVFNDNENASGDPGTGFKPPVMSLTRELSSGDMGGFYVFMEDWHEASRKVFVDMVMEGKEGLWIMRRPPANARKTYNLVKTPMIWLTTTKVEGEVCIAPTEGARLGTTINTFLEASKHFIILFEGLEYLSANSGFQNNLRLIHFLNDKAMGKKGLLLLNIVPHAFEKGQLALLESEALKVFGVNPFKLEDEAKNKVLTKEPS